LTVSTSEADPEEPKVVLFQVPVQVPAYAEAGEVGVRVGVALVPGVTVRVAVAAGDVGVAVETGGVAVAGGPDTVLLSLHPAGVRIPRRAASAKRSRRSLGCMRPSFTSDRISWAGILSLFASSASACFLNRSDRLPAAPVAGGRFGW
jgi:hypothetical protein